MTVWKKYIKSTSLNDYSSLHACVIVSHVITNKLFPTVTLLHLMQIGVSYWMFIANFAILRYKNVVIPRQDCLTSRARKAQASNKENQGKYIPLSLIVIALFCLRRRGGNHTALRRQIDWLCWLCSQSWTQTVNSYGNFCFLSCV